MDKSFSKPEMLEFREIDAKTFFAMATRCARSEDVGPVGSQFEQELQNSDENVGILGLYACDRLIGAISYGVQKIPRGPRLVSARLDLVVNEPDCRGLGVGALLIAAFFDKMIADYDKRLLEISTVAVNPIVGHVCEALDFAPPPKGMSVPRYHIDLEPNGKLEKFSHKVDAEFKKRMNSLKLRCLKCKQFRWVIPWCRPKEEKGAA